MDVDQASLLLYFIWIFIFIVIYEIGITYTQDKVGEEALVEWETSQNTMLHEVQESVQVG